MMARLFPELPAGAEQQERRDRRHLPLKRRALVGLWFLSWALNLYWGESTNAFVCLGVATILGLMPWAPES